MSLNHLQKIYHILLVNMTFRTYQPTLFFIFTLYIFPIWDDGSVNKLEGWVILTEIFNNP